MIKKILIISLSALFIYFNLHLLKDFFKISPFILSIFRWVVLFFFIIWALKKKSLTIWILLSMPIGVEIGLDFPFFSQEIRVLSKIFIRLIKTIIAPVLFSTLVVGIASHSDIKSLGRMGWKSLLYFEIMTLFALMVGLITINISKAGEGIKIPDNKEFLETSEFSNVSQSSWQDILLHCFPENFIKSIYHGEVLPIVVFSVFFGISMVFIKEDKRKPVLEFTESLSEIVFKLTSIIMYFAPLGVGAAIAYTVGNMGLDVLSNLLKLLGTLYVALICFLIFVLGPVLFWFKIPLKSFLKAIYNPVSLSFATTSSESALPILMENLTKLGVPKKVVSFVIPAGYSFNLDGTTLYLSLASVFIAQAAGIDLSIKKQIFICLTLLFTSKGVAAVPRASLVILLGTATSFNLPIWPIFVIMGIDELMDMARTTVNVIGNALASCVIARSEGEFDDKKAKAYLEEST